MAKKNGNKKSKAVEHKVSADEIVSDADLESMMESSGISEMMAEMSEKQASADLENLAIQALDIKQEQLASGEMVANGELEIDMSLPDATDACADEDLGDEPGYKDLDLQPETMALMNAAVKSVEAAAPTKAPKAPKVPKLDPCAEYDPMIQAMVRRFPSNEMAWAFQQKNGTVTFTTADTRAEMCEHLQYGACDPTKTVVVFTEKHDHNQAIALKKATKMLAKLV